MPQFLYQLKLTKPSILAEAPSAEESKILGRHVAYLDDLAKRGIVLLAGRTQITDSRAFGIVIFIADTEQEAEQIMRNDPTVKWGLMNAELYPYKIASLSPTIVNAVASR